MSDTVVISLIGSAATVVVSLINAGLALLSHERGKRNEQSLSALKDQTNGIQEKLVEASGKLEFARGVKQETDRQEGRDEIKK